eukprot:2444531-Rhodomonas_salina.1
MRGMRMRRECGAVMEHARDTWEAFNRVLRQEQEADRAEVRGLVGALVACVALARDLGLHAEALEERAALAVPAAVEHRVALHLRPATEQHTVIIVTIGIHAHRHHQHHPRQQPPACVALSCHT